MFSMNTLELLEDLPISRKLSFQQIKKISKYCVILDYAEKETLFSKNVEFPYVGIIISGKVKYSFTDPLSKKKIKLGSFKKYPVGMFHFLESKQQDISIKAVEPTKILAIDYDVLKVLEKKFPLFTTLLYKSIIKLQMAITKRILNIVVKLVYK